MSKEVFSNGTLGDSYFMLLKLWDKKITKINHYCYQSKHLPNIKKIFSLIKGIEFNPVSADVVKRDDMVVGFLKDGETYTPFPDIELPSINHIKLPESYRVVQIESGVDINKHPWRFLDSSDTEHIPNDLPIVLIGTDNRNIDFLDNFNIIDLRYETELLESFSVIKNSSGFYGPQGLLGFVALSLKIPTKLWLKHNMEINGMNYRINRIPEWGKYITYINKI